MKASSWSMGNSNVALVFLQFSNFSQRNNHLSPKVDLISIKEKDKKRE